MAGYNVATITDEKLGVPPVIHRTIVLSTADEYPVGAVSLQALREAEIARAAKVRNFQKSALGTLLVREGDAVTRVGLTDLIRGLPSGSVVYEPIPPADQANEGAFARFTGN